MKKVTLIFNIVLALAVVALFILHFTQKSSKGIAKNGKVETSAALSAQFSAAWVNVDTILNNYDMYFDMRKELEENSRQLEAGFDLGFLCLDRLLRVEHRSLGRL